VKLLRSKHCILQVSGALHGTWTIHLSCWLHLHGVYQELDLEFGHSSTPSFWHASLCIERSEMRRSVLLNMVTTGIDTVAKFRSDSFLMSSESCMQTAWFFRAYPTTYCAAAKQLHINQLLVYEDTELNKPLLT
jgi:hypothetical protein